ncbi:hypothetical protein NP233_g6112 [Leucocoprinus birnbaumii]|uniref:Uncharacterized protein n=1 Tax=Leucocoprinus birnbaumii TaxID=56174 RepID=A0AAD5YW29_9AGAR|nr:hypothetical protein NP233_g6112 [Leucocoprinus birnbaumii]
MMPVPSDRLGHDSTELEALVPAYLLLCRQLDSVLGYNEPFTMALSDFNLDQEFYQFLNPPLNYPYKFLRVDGHPIANSWPKIGADFYKLLDSRRAKWTSIDPVSFANAGEKTPFCKLLIWISVKHKTLIFDDAVVATNAVKDILRIRLPQYEVAFRESEVTQSAGPKLLSFTPSSTPSPNIANLSRPR